MQTSKVYKFIDSCDDINYKTSTVILHRKTLTRVSETTFRAYKIQQTSKLIFGLIDYPSDFESSRVAQHYVVHKYKKDSQAFNDIEYF